MRCYANANRRFDSMKCIIKLFSWLLRNIENLSAQANFSWRFCHMHGMSQWEIHTWMQWWKIISDSIFALQIHVCILHWHFNSQWTIIFGFSANNQFAQAFPVYLITLQHYPIYVIYYRQSYAISNVQYCRDYNGWWLVCNLTKFTSWLIFYLFQRISRGEQIPGELRYLPC